MPVQHLLGCPHMRAHARTCAPARARTCPHIPTHGPAHARTCGRLYKITERVAAHARTCLRSIPSAAWWARPVRMLCVPVRGMCGTRLRPGAPGSAGPRTRYLLRVSPAEGRTRYLLALARPRSLRFAVARAGLFWHALQPAPAHACTCGGVSRVKDHVAAHARTCPHMRSSARPRMPAHTDARPRTCPRMRQAL